MNCTWCERNVLQCKTFRSHHVQIHYGIFFPNYYRFYEFFALGIASSSSVRWSNAYVDASGLGLVVTAAQPVFDRSGSIPIFLGVIGVDISMDEILLQLNRDTKMNQYLFITSQAGKISSRDDYSMNFLREFIQRWNSFMQNERKFA